MFKTNNNCFEVCLYVTCYSDCQETCTLTHTDTGMKYLLITDENDTSSRKRLNEKVKMTFGAVGYQFESNASSRLGWSIINTLSTIAKRAG